MKKYVDWDKIEEETVSAEEACECTRSKLQPLIDFVVKLFPKQMESFRGEDAEVIPEKKKLTKDERLALIKKSAEMLQPVKVFRPDAEGNLRLVRVISRKEIV